MRSASFKQRRSTMYARVPCNNNILTYYCYCFETRRNALFLYVRIIIEVCAKKNCFCTAKPRRIHSILIHRMLTIIMWTQCDEKCLIHYFVVEQDEGTHTHAHTSTQCNKTKIDKKPGVNDYGKGTCYYLYLPTIFSSYIIVFVCAHFCLFLFFDIHIL